MNITNATDKTTNGKPAPAKPRFELVPLKSITLGENYSRGTQKPEEVKAMAENIAAQAKAAGSSDPADGLLQAIGVRETSPGKYEVEYGFKRFAALEILRATHVPVRISSAAAGASDARNMAENNARSDANLYRMSKRLYEMVEPQPDSETPPTYDRKEAAALVGFTPAHANNLIRLQKKLSPEILAYWERDAAKGALLPVRMLLSFAALPDHADQNKAFEEWLGGQKRAAAEKGESGEGRKKMRKKGSFARPTKKLIAKAIEEHPANSGKRIALEWVMGMRKKLDE